LWNYYLVICTNYDYSLHWMRVFISSKATHSDILLFTTEYLRFLEVLFHFPRNIWSFLYLGKWLNLHSWGSHVYNEHYVLVGTVKVSMIIK